MLTFKVKGTSASCPPPNVDGSTILAGTNCTLIDLNGLIWQFDGNGPTTYPSASGNWEFTRNGVAITSAVELQRNLGGNIFALINSGPYQLWFLYTSSDKPQAVTPAAGAVGNIFVNQTTAAAYRTMSAMCAAAAAGQTLIIPLMPNGIPLWWQQGVVAVDNVTISGNTGAFLGGSEAQGKAPILQQANNLTVKNLQIAYNQFGGPGAGIRLDAGFQNLTVDGCTIFSCDDGVLTAGRVGGTVTITNTAVHDCGDLTGGLAHGSTHNLYIGRENTIDFQNVTSYRPVGGGHCAKSRTQSGTVGTTLGCIFAQLGGDSTACFDIPCGGSYTIKNSIFQRGPNAENNRFVTFGVEMNLTGVDNCPADGRAQSLTIDGCWFIDDGPLNSTATQICQNAFALTGVNVVLTNCKLVSNPLTSPIVFGANVTNGAGNLQYASRAAAIAAGENIPAAYSDSLACLPPVPGDALVTLMTNTASGSWTSVTSSNLSAVKYSGSLASSLFGSIGPAAIMSVWSGGCVDTDSNGLIVWGGGHQAYWGNELYRFNFKTLQWARLTAPSDISAWSHLTSVLPDGNPAVPHTYDTLVYIPGSGFMNLGLQGTQDNGGGSAQCFLINPATQSPSSTGTWAAKATIPATNGSLQPGSVSAYDSVSGHAFLAMQLVGGGGFGLYDYNPATDSWTIHGSDGLPHIQMTAAINPGVEMLVTGNGSTVAISITGGTIGTMTTLTTTGDKTVENANGPGFVYYPSTGEYVGWNGGTTLYRFNRTTKVWTARTATGTAPGCNDSTGPCTSTTGVQTDGTYGRFQLLGSPYNCFLAVNSINDNVNFYKPDF